MFGRLKRNGRRLLVQTKLRIWSAGPHVHRMLSWSRNQSLGLVVLLPILGMLIGVWLNYGLRYSLSDGAPIEAGLLGDLLVSLGTALAGVSVIAFSLALFLQQSVSDLYSPQYFVAYSFDRKQKSVLTILVAVVLGQLAYGFYLRVLDDTAIPWPAFVIPVTLASTALVFSLLWWQYLHVAKKIKPAVVIRFLYREASKQFLAFHKQVTRAARLWDMNAGEDSEQTLARVYATILPQAEEILLRPIYALSEVTMRLANRGDGVAVQQGLEGLTAVLAEYLKARRTSSLSFSSATQPLAVESDSQSLLNKSFEKLNQMGDRFLGSGQIDHARALVDTYDNLAAAAIQIEFVGRPHENPIAYQSAFYLKDFVNAAMRKDDTEVPFRAIEVFARLGQSAAARSNVELVYTAAQELASIGVYGATSRVWFISEHCIEAECRIIGTLFQSRGDASGLFDEVLMRLFFIHQAAVVAQTVTSERTFDGTAVLLKPFQNLQEIVAWVRTQHDQGDDTQRLELSRAFESFLEPFYTTLRSACEKIDLGSVYTDAAAELIFETVRACVAIEGGTDDSRMARHIKAFTWLPMWFGDHSEKLKSPRGLEHAIDAACNIAMMLITEKEAEDRVVAALDTQFVIVKHALEKNSGGYGYYEPRLMLRICYCGTVALKYQRPEIVEKTLSMIKEFEEVQTARFNNDARQPSLLKEFIGWQKRFVGRQRPTIWENAYSVAASLVTSKEVDTFSAKAWGLEMSGNRGRGTQQ